MEPILTVAIVALSMYFILLGIFSRIDMKTYGHSYSFHFMWNLSLTGTQFVVCFLSLLFAIAPISFFLI